MLKDKGDFKEGENTNLRRENLTGRNEESPRKNTPARVLSANSMIGDNVENSKGENLGEIRDIMLNVNSGCIQYVVLEFGGFLGFGEKLFAIPYKALALNQDRQLFILDKDKEYLEKAPGFDKNHWPETNSKHWKDVGSYWGDYRAPVFPGSIYY